MSGDAGMSRRAAVLLALIAGFAGMALRGFVSSGSSTEPRGSTSAPMQVVDKGPGPWSYDDGIPVGFAHTDAGALAAASSYVTTGQVLLDLSPTEVPQAVRRFASAETASTQTADIGAQLAALRETLADGTGRTRYIQAVLATRLDAYTDNRARVSVWSVGILWRLGAANPQAGWTTSAFDLVWEDETWKVWAETITSGPSPAPNAGSPPVDAAELDRLLVGFDIAAPSR
jgi:hypothetical protein